MLINLRNALMAGKRLPYDAEVEYLEGDGTAYIATGVSQSAGDTIHADFTFGYKSGSSSRRFIVSDGYAYHSRYCDISSGNRLSVNSRNTLPVLTAEQLYSGYITLEPNKTSLGVIVNETSYTDEVSATSTWTSNNILIFRINSTYAGSGQRIAMMKLYKNGVLVRDYIPVRKGTVGYLYDRVSGKLFGNAGTGDFVLGPDVVPVEWLSSDGNQYIDTGYVFQFGDDVSVTFQPLATPTQTTYFFGADTAYNAGLNVHYDPSFPSLGLRYCYGGGFGADNTGVIISPAQAFSTSTIYACNGNINKRTINSGENTRSVQNSGLNSASVILFCARRNANIRPASTGWAIASRFFGFDAKRNGAGIRAIKPVRVGTDATSWEGAMMDVLTRRIYRNAGTGAFTYGNDLKYPIPAE